MTSLDTPASASTPKVKKSLRSKRLMRPVAPKSDDSQSPIPELPNAKDNAGLPTEHIEPESEPADKSSLDDFAPAESTITARSSEEFVEAKESPAPSSFSSPKTRAQAGSFGQANSEENPQDVVHDIIDLASPGDGQQASSADQPGNSADYDTFVPVSKHSAVSKDEEVSQERSLLDYFDQEQPDHRREAEQAPASPKEEESLVSVPIDTAPNTNNTATEPSELPSTADNKEDNAVGNLISPLTETPGPAEEEAASAHSPPGPDVSAAELESEHSKISSPPSPAPNTSGKESTLGRSASLRFNARATDNNALSPEGRRRPSEALSPGSASSKKSNRRSIMLTSFVPPVGMGASTSPSRSSSESQSETQQEQEQQQQQQSSDPAMANGVVEITIGGKTFKRSSMLDGQLAGAPGRRANRLSPELGMSSIRLRPSADVAESQATETKPSAKAALQSIGERIGVIKEDVGTPDWVKEVQRRKREAQERDEAEKRAGRTMTEAPLVELAEPQADIAAGHTRDTSASLAAIDDEDAPLTEIDLNAKDSDADEHLDKNKPLPALAPAPMPFTLPPVPEVHEHEHQTDLPSASARSIYRSLSASLGISQSADTRRDSSGSNNSRTAVAQQGALPTVPERQRSTSQTTSSPSSSQGGLFAAVSSFFGRSSTQQSAPPSASALTTPGINNGPPAMYSTGSSSSNVSRGTIEFPGMRPSHSDARPAQQAPSSKASLQAERGASEMDSLLHQLEAQNQQILKDNKARVFTRETLDKHAKADDESAQIDWDFWGNLINDYERVTRSDPRKLARLIYGGVPKAVRGTVWQIMSGARSDPALGSTFRHLMAQPASSEDAAHEKQIKHDLARTFPKLDYFRDSDGAGQEGLYNVLRVYARFDAEVGYCQGLSFVVGPMLLNMPDEDAFCVLVRLMYRYGLRGHFLPAMDDLRLRLYQFEHAFQETLPRLAAHFQHQGVEPTMYVSQWLMTMFAYRLPIELTFRLFDVVFAEGLDSLLRIAIAVLKRSQTRLLSLGFEAILQYLNDGPLFAFYSHAAPDMLVRDANQVTAVNSRYLQKLRRRYIEELDRLAEEEDEANRMRVENESLKQENVKLREAAQKLANTNSELNTTYREASGELERSKKEMGRLAQVIEELEGRLRLERVSAEESLREDMDVLGQKNVQLTVKNQQLEDSLQDMEAALIQIKLLYAESENQRELMTKKFDDLRRALH